MRFLFIAPRYHTNQIPIVMGLLELGHEVKFFVNMIGNTEDHTLIEPVQICYSGCSLREIKKLQKSMSPNQVESIMAGHFIPDKRHLKQELKSYHPDVVICREKTYFTLLTKYFCDQMNINCIILYDQEPYYKETEPLEVAREKTRVTTTLQGVLDKIAKKLKALTDERRWRLKQLVKTTNYPTVHITPVLTRDSSMDLLGMQTTPHTYWLPFVMPCNEAALHRAYCPGGKIRVLEVGKYREYKNHFMFVDAIGLLKDKEKFQVTILGQAINSDELDYYERLKKYVEGKGLGNVIALKKNVAYSSMQDVYLNHDVFVLSSKQECASIAVLEAMAHGLVAISTDHNGTATYIEAGKSGYTFATNDVVELAQKIETFTACDNVEQMGREAYRHVQQDYSFEKYYDILRRVLAIEFGLYL